MFLKKSSTKFFTKSGQEKRGFCVDSAWISCGFWMDFSVVDFLTGRGFLRSTISLLKMYQKNTRRKIHTARRGLMPSGTRKRAQQQKNPHAPTSKDIKIHTAQTSPDIKFHTISDLFKTVEDYQAWSLLTGNYLIFLWNILFHTILFDMFESLLIYNTPRSPHTHSI